MASQTIFLATRNLVVNTDALYNSMIQFLKGICSWIVCDLRGMKYQTTRENSYSEELHKSCFPPSISFFLLAQQPPVGQGLLIHEVSGSHTTTHYSQ
jgi:hypothetical protein